MTNKEGWQLMLTEMLAKASPETVKDLVVALAKSNLTVRRDC